MKRRHCLIVGAVVVGVCLAGSMVTAQEGCAGSQKTFLYTGATETYVVPSGVSELFVTAVGGGGGTSSTSSGGSPGVGGGGALISAVVPVTPAATSPIA